MTVKESMYLVEKRCWLKAHEAVRYLEFKCERRKREWYVTEEGRWVHWNA